MKHLRRACFICLMLLCVCLALASCGECKHGEFAPNYKTVSPTCTTDGVYVYTCLLCEEEVSVAPRADDTLMLAYGHTADRGSVSTPPTCTEAGERTFTCKTCDAALPELTEEVAATGHKMNTKTYESNGETHWYACTVCGAKDAEESCEYIFAAFDEQTHVSVCYACEYVDAASSAAHTLDEGVVTREATCAAAGERAYACAACDYVRTEEIPALAHSFDTTTFVSDGVQHRHECTACGTPDPDSVADCVYATVSETLPTEDSCRAGVRVLACEGCAVTKTELIPSDAPHTLTSAIADGQVTYACSVCEASFTSTVMHFADGSGVTDFTAKIDNAKTIAGYTADSETYLPTVTEDGNTYYTLVRNTVSGSMKAQMEFAYATAKTEVKGRVGVVSVCLRGSDNGLSKGWNLRLYNKVGEDKWSATSNEAGKSFHDLYLLLGAADGKTVNDANNKKLLTLSTDAFTKLDITFTVDDAADTITLTYYADGVFVREVTRNNNLAYDTPACLFIAGTSAASTESAVRTLVFDDLLFAYTDDGRESFLQ